jgi:hypothetical protein
MLSLPQLRGNFRAGDCWVIAGNAVLGDQFMVRGKITTRSIDAVISDELDGASPAIARSP